MKFVMLYRVPRKSRGKEHPDPEDKEELDSFAIELLETVQEAAETTLPITVSNRSDKKTRKTTPGWTEAVKPYKDQAYFLHQIWLSCGRPINTEVHNIMKRARKKYHYEYRKCSKAEDKIRGSKLLDAYL